MRVQTCQAVVRLHLSGPVSDSQVKVNAYSTAQTCEEERFKGAAAVCAHSGATQAELCTALGLCCADSPTVAHKHSFITCIGCEPFRDETLHATYTVFPTARGTGTAGPQQQPLPLPMLPDFVWCAAYNCSQSRIQSGQYTPHSLFDECR